MCQKEIEFRHIIFFADTNIYVMYANGLGLFEVKVMKMGRSHLFLFLVVSYYVDGYLRPGADDSRK